MYIMYSVYIDFRWTYGHQADSINNPWVAPKIGGPATVACGSPGDGEEIWGMCSWCSLGTIGWCILMNLSYLWYTNT